MDYTVCLFSEVFVTTHGGNFPHFLMGHRRFLFDGHSKTINPDKRKLVPLFQDMNIRYCSSVILSFFPSLQYHVGTFTSMMVLRVLKF